MFNILSILAVIATFCSNITTIYAFIVKIYKYIKLKLTKK